MHFICKKISLADYVNDLQSSGRYAFTLDEALTTLNTTPDAFRSAALRLIRKKRLVKPAHGFYLIVPVEYQTTGASPAVWFIDSLMKNYQQPYYVGLLSAAALHGAAHQQPQVFQIITNKPLRALNIGRSHIQFLIKKKILSNSFQLLNTPTGYMQVSTPEATAIDLIQYVKDSGHLHHIATVLAELQEKLNVNKLIELITIQKTSPVYIQRLGYLLKLTGAQPELLQQLKQWIKIHKPRVVALRTDKDYQKIQKNSEWRLYINESIEVDDL